MYFITRARFEIEGMRHDFDVRLTYHLEGKRVEVDKIETASPWPDRFRKWYDAGDDLWTFVNYHQNNQLNRLMLAQAAKESEGGAA